MALGAMVAVVLALGAVVAVVFLSFGAFILLASLEDVVRIDAGGNERSRILPERIVASNKSFAFSIFCPTVSPTMSKCAAVNQPFRILTIRTIDCTTRHTPAKPKYLMKNYR